MRTIKYWINKSRYDHGKKWEKKRRCGECWYEFSTTQEWGKPALGTVCPRCSAEVDLYLNREEGEK